ncbi:MAG: hypothetical protein OXK80_04685 [Bdellovibrionales bacterium]|nr:hypothetical protein [Bdellovibrionales bacterium]
MTLKHFLLQFVFIFIFSSCTSSGGFDDEAFQAEEEEYMESKGGDSQVALSEDDEGADDIYEEQEIDGEILAGDESDIMGGDTSIDGEATGDFDDSLSDEFDTTGADNLVNVGTSQLQKKTWVPLKKIPTQSWKQDGKWVNAVYIARDGEDLSQISAKIYGHTNLIDELRNFNPFLKRRSPKVGDKIYYNSPNRPNDGVKFSHYYEDNNQTAMTHDIQAGENIRTIATQLLGHKDSWKEIWATNPQVESKWTVSETVTVYYWPGSAAMVAENTAPEPEVLPEPEAPSEPESVEEMPIAEEPPTLDGGAEDLAMPEEVLPAPSPEPNIPPSEGIGADSDGSSFASKNAGKIKVIAIAGILLILAAFFIRMIRNRKNRADFDFSQTHIDIDNIEE